MKGAERSAGLWMGGKAEEKGRRKGGNAERGERKGDMAERVSRITGKVPIVATIRSATTLCILSLLSSHAPSSSPYCTTVARWLSHFFRLVLVHHLPPWNLSL